MAVELAKTFLEIVRTGNFIQASKVLNLTQSTVSARIQTLEARLGEQLLIRNRGGVQLTSAGTRFLPHAANIVQAWAHAKQTISVPEGYQSQITIGARFGIWDELLLQWTKWMQINAPEIAIRTEFGMAESLLPKVKDGQLDLAIIYSPAPLPGIEAKPFVTDEFVMVSNEEKLSAMPSANYIYVDWGEEFRRQHRLHFPNYRGSGRAINSGVYGLKMLVDTKGAGYFPSRMIANGLEFESFKIVDAAPKIDSSAYLIFQQNTTGSETELALKSLRECAEKLNLAR